MRRASGSDFGAPEVALANETKRHTSRRLPAYSLWLLAEFTRSGGDVALPEWGKITRLSSPSWE